MATRSIADSFHHPSEHTPITDEDGMPVKAEVLGAVDDASETDPDAETASIASLLRGILTQQTAILAILTDVYDSETHTINVTSG